MVGKMAKDVGTAICKSIVASFLPCLVTFLRFHPYMLLHFLNYFFVTCILCHGWEVDTGFIQPKVKGREVIAQGLLRRDLRPRVG